MAPFKPETNPISNKLSAARNNRIKEMMTHQPDNFSRITSTSQNRQSSLNKGPRDKVNPMLTVQRIYEQTDAQKIKRQ